MPSNGTSGISWTYPKTIQVQRSLSATPGALVLRVPHLRDLGTQGGSSRKAHLGTVFPGGPTVDRLMDLNARAAPVYILLIASLMLLSILREDVKRAKHNLGCW